MHDPFHILSMPASACTVYSEVGTMASGYSEGGPYHCADCIHKPSPTSPYCIHPKVLDDPEMQHRIEIVDGRPAAHIDLEKGCCKYVKPPEEAGIPCEGEGHSNETGM